MDAVKAWVFSFLFLFLSSVHFMLWLFGWYSIMFIIIIIITTRGCLLSGCWPGDKCVAAAPKHFISVTGIAL